MSLLLLLRGGVGGVVISTSGTRVLTFSLAVGDRRTFSTGTGVRQTTSTAVATRQTVSTGAGIRKTFSTEG